MATPGCQCHFVVDSAWLEKLRLWPSGEKTTPIELQMAGTGSRLPPVDTIESLVGSHLVQPLDGKGEL